MFNKLIKYFQILSPIPQLNMELLPPNVQTCGDTLGTTQGFLGYGAASGTHETLSVDSSDRYEGTNSIKFTNTLEGSNFLTLYLANPDTTAYVNVAPGGTYTIEGYVKSSNAQNSRWRIDWINSVGGLISTSIASKTASPTSWTNKTYYDVAPALSVKARIGLLYETATLNQYIAVDKLSFKRTA